MAGFRPSHLYREIAERSEQLEHRALSRALVSAKPRSTERSNARPNPEIPREATNQSCRRIQQVLIAACRIREFRRPLPGRHPLPPRSESEGVPDRQGSSAVRDSDRASDRHSSRAAKSLRAHGSRSPECPL
jgi:hypothetical protein